MGNDFYSLPPAYEAQREGNNFSFVCSLSGREYPSSQVSGPSSVPGEEGKGTRAPWSLVPSPFLGSSQAHWSMISGPRSFPGRRERRVPQSSPKTGVPRPHPWPGTGSGLLTSPPPQPEPGQGYPLTPPPMGHAMDRIQRW